MEFGKVYGRGVASARLDMSAAYDEFEWREIVCANEDAAKTEAERQQSSDAFEAEWIYLRNANGQWVARRTPRDWQPPPVSMRKAFWEWLTNPFDWLTP